jgi:ankyrin repeat protein
MRWFTVLFFCLAAVFSLWCAENDDLTRALRGELDKRDSADMAVVTSLLEAGADPNGSTNPRDSDGWTFLISALYRDNIQIARLLIDAGADPNKPDLRGRSAAYHIRRNETVSFFISNGGRFDITDKDGVSPLMYQITEERVNAAISILEWEEEHSPNFSAGFKNRKDYYTDLLIRLLRNDNSGRVKAPLVGRLLEAGADPSARDNDGNLIVFLSKWRMSPQMEIVPLFIERGIPLNEFYKGGGSKERTLLMFAAEDSAFVVKLLLEKGADPNLRNSFGETALMYAEGDEAAAAALLEKGVDPNLQDNDGDTALIRSYFYPNVQKLLLRSGADPAIKNNRGSTALNSWYRKADMPLLEELLALGCPLDEPNLRGFTPLMNAAASAHYSNNNYSAAVMTLLEKGADPSRRDNEGKSVLFHYIESFRGRVNVPKEAETVITAMLEKGAQPADIDEDGNSALLYLIKESRRDSEYRPLLRLARKYASKDEISDAGSAARSKGYYKYIGENVLKTSMALTVPLLIGGLSIGMREGVYADDPYKNWMGGVNSFLTFTSSGFLLGSFIGVNSFQGSGAWADMFGPFLYGTIGGAIGLISGIIFSSLPSVQAAFKKTAMLYYAPTAISAIGITIVIFNIWE